MDEVKRTHLEKLKWPPNLADSFQNAVRAAFPHACVSGYGNFLTSLTNDPKDRHVLAAAIRIESSLILTFNLKHFPEAALAPWNIKAGHPEEYLLILYEMEPKQVIGCLGEIAGRRSEDIEDVLIRLGKAVPKFSTRVLDDLNA